MTSLDRAKWKDIFAPAVSNSMFTNGLSMQQNGIDDLSKVISRIAQPEKLSKQKVIDSLIGKKSTGIISNNSTPARKRRKRREPQQVIASVEQSEPMAGGSIPSELPKGTIAIADGIYQLPTGHIVRRIQDEQTA